MKAEDLLFKWCVSQVNKVTLDSLPCRQVLGEPEVLYMAENG